MRSAFVIVVVVVLCYRLGYWVVEAVRIESSTVRGHQI